MATPIKNKFQQLFLIPAILVTLVGCNPTPPRHSNSSTQRHIYILKSSGIWDGCAEAVFKMLFTAGIQSQIIGPEQLKAAVEPQDMIIVGGTAGNNVAKPADWAQAALDDILATRWPRVIGFSWWNERWENDDNPRHNTTMRVQDTIELANVFRRKLATATNLVERPMFICPHPVDSGSF